MTSFQDGKSEREQGKESRSVGRREILSAILGRDTEAQEDPDSSEETTSGSETEAHPTPPEPESEGPPVERRGFFREVLLSVLGPAADFLESRLDDVKVGFAPLAAVSRPERLLRPPGALTESDFVRQCSRSGECAEACPVKAIKSLDVDDEDLDGTPCIDASEQPCVVCDGLHCMEACPSGALQPVPRDEINMGLAVADPELCLRAKGEDCRTCIEKCPIGERALTIAEGRVVVLDTGCVGCGVCEHACPASPKAITVYPV